MISNAELREIQYKAVKTTQDIKVRKVKDIPTYKPTLGVNKHIETGLCLMLHTVKDGTVLEIRGYDVNGEEFSYKFHHENSLKQPLNMRAVGMSGGVNKLKVSLDDNPDDKHMKIHDLRTVEGDND